MRQYTSNIAWPAPAKLNLMLRIVGRRDDGYHLLQTVFQFLEFSDLLYFRVRGDGVVRRCRGLPGVAEREDLIWRAADLLRRESGCDLGADIDLDKRLPMGGGLGGGSSDAATVLVVLNRLWGLGFSTRRLADLGLGLGADVPVFVQGQAAWAEGVGDEFTPLVLDEPWYLVLVPDCHVSTRAVFSDPDLTRDSTRITIADFLAGDDVNDCMSVVRRNYPQVAAALEWLEQFTPARLTGTGGCVFGAFASEASAQAVRDRLPPAWCGIVSRGSNQSPLLKAEEDSRSLSENSDCSEGKTG